MLIIHDDHRTSNGHIFSKPVSEMSFNELDAIIDPIEISECCGAGIKHGDVCIRCLEHTSVEVVENARN